MNIDELPGQLEAFTERARDALTQEISTARATLQRLKGKIAEAGKALADLRDQHKLAETELAAVTKDLHRTSTKVSLDHEITEARKTLEKLKTEKAALEISVEGLVTQRRAAEAQTAALRIEASQWAASRTETEAAIKRIRERLG